jgi:hypothetical protein
MSSLNNEHRRICSLCAVANPSSNRFCGSCGRSLDSPDNQPPTAPPEPITNFSTPIFAQNRKTKSSVLKVSLLLSAIILIILIALILGVGKKAKTVSTPNQKIVSAAEKILSIQSDVDAMYKARELVEKGATTPEYKAMQRRLNFAESSPLHKEAQKLSSKISGLILPALQQQLALEYKTLLEELYPHLNFIEADFHIGMLRGRHEYFSEYTFKSGSEVRVIQNWIRKNQSRLEEAEVMMVGIQQRNGTGSIASLMVSTQELIR